MNLSCTVGNNEHNIHNIQYAIVTSTDARFTQTSTSPDSAGTLNMAERLPQVQDHLTTNQVQVQSISFLQTVYVP